MNIRTHDGSGSGKMHGDRTYGIYRRLARAMIKVPEPSMGGTSGTTGLRSAQSGRIVASVLLGSRQVYLPLEAESFRTKGANTSRTWTQSSPRLHARMYVYVSLFPLLSHLPLKISSHSPGPADVLWEKFNPNLDAFRTIISNHFGSPCQSQQPLQSGSYARTFLHILEDGLHIVGRVILPVRRTLKTEAEVAAMDSIRGMSALLRLSPLLILGSPARTSIPVPRVHLYCSTPDNPVRAEWVLMDYVPGLRLMDCWGEMGVPQKTRTAKDLARVMAEMFALTASHCGVLLCDRSLNDSQRSAGYRYEPFGGDTTVEAYTQVGDGDFLIGPVSDVTFLEFTGTVPASLCGPFTTERAFLEAFGYNNARGTRLQDKVDIWPIDRMFEIYDVIRPLYAPPVDSSAPFHFAHADLSVANLIVDPKSGEITGLIDWEMAGFRPAWLCTGSGTWFDDDFCRFVAEDHQDGPDGYGNDAETDPRLRQVFLTELEAHNPTLLEHNRKGVELRALFYNLCNEYTSNTVGWIEQYEKYGWDVTERGPFPFEVWKWVMDLTHLYQK